MPWASDHMEVSTNFGSDFETSHLIWKSIGKNMEISSHPPRPPLLCVWILTGDSMYKTAEDSPRHTVDDSIPSSTTETSTIFFTQRVQEKKQRVSPNSNSIYCRFVVDSYNIFFGTYKISQIHWSRPTIPAPRLPPVRPMVPPKALNIKLDLLINYLINSILQYYQN